MLCILFTAIVSQWQSENHTSIYGPQYKHQKEFGWKITRMFHNRIRQLSAVNYEYDVYQFGVYLGGSMKHMHNKVRFYHHMWGFDSFKGLPAETPGIKIEGNHWLPGAFSSEGALKQSNSTNARRIVEKILARVNVRSTLIEGFFNESLPRMILSNFRRALLIDIDVDLYISAKQVLDWLFKNKIATAGSLIRYDDWNSGDTSWGEPKAHAEIVSIYKVKLRRFGWNEYEVIDVGY
jgi:hypothetical protein